jgi:hypothetical protein
MTDQPAEPPHEGNLAEWLRWAETKIALSLAVTLYFKPPPSAIVEGLLSCYGDYLELCEPDLRWFAIEPTGRYRKANAKALRIPFQRVPEDVDHGKRVSWAAFSGDHYWHAAPFQFYAFVEKPNDESLSWVRAAFPVEMFSSDLDRFVDLVKAFAARVPFFFGYAGLSFGQSTEIVICQRNEVYLLPVAMRFTGVEVEGEIATSLCCKEAIKGVNWLTLLSAPFVKKLGGKEALRSGLSDGIDLHDVRTGLMIQAGSAPGLGDINAEERLPLYREVHRALSPVRVVDHWPFHVFAEDATRRWMRRFDD